MLTLAQKLLEIQRAVDRVVKDATNTNDKYAYASSGAVLETVRPKMNELGLLLEMEITGARLHTGETRTGTTRYLTEMDCLFRWVNVDSPQETREIKWYAQGVDLAGEKGPGKGATYAEKYFLLKYFHVPTPKDDPDSDERTASGEKRQRGTRAAKETVEMQRVAIDGMIRELCSGDEAKMAQSYIAFTKSNGYEGVDSLEKVSDSQAAVVYGKLKAKYIERTGKTWDPPVLKE